MGNKSLTSSLSPPNARSCTSSACDGVDSASGRLSGHIGIDDGDGHCAEPYAGHGSAGLPAQTRNAQTALAKISQQVGAINHMNAQIASASIQQSVVAEDVAQNITRIHSSTVQSATGSREVATASQELAQLADRLTQKVAFFSVA